MYKLTITELLSLAITIFGATNMMALQEVVAQNYYNNEQLYADHYPPSINYGEEEEGNDNSYSYNNYYPLSPSSPSS